MTATPAPARAVDRSRLSVPERLSYGLGDFGINLYFIAAMTYLLYFYTDILGLSPQQAAWVMLVARLVDAVTDPVMGLIVERTNSRFGRLRPWIVAGAIPLALLAVLTFTVPDLSQNGKLLWAYATYIGFGIAYTVVSVPYSALTASLTSNHHERTVLSTVRMACAFSGGFVVSVFMLQLANRFTTQADGFQSVMLGFAVVATGCLVASALFTRERVAPPARQKLALSDSLRAVFRNPPLAVVIVLFTCGMLAFTVRQTIAVYYFQYNLQRPELIGDFFTLTLGTMLVGLIAVPRLTTYTGKAGAIMVGTAITIAGCLGLYVTPYDAPGQVMFWGCVVSLGATPIAVLGWAMIPDTIEYAQWRHGVRADGAVYSFASFFQKLAKSVGGAGVAAVLAWAGYQANAEQSAQSLDAIRAMMSWGPAVIMVFAAVTAAAYPLNKARYQAMLEDISSRERDGSRSRDEFRERAAARERADSTP
jgi:sugar (glycoside-pentoside-hexuronide) transporter